MPHLTIPWALTRTVAPTDHVVELAEANDFARVDIAADDPVAVPLLRAAEEAIEDQIGRALREQTWALRLDRFPAWSIRTPRPPLKSVTDIKYVDSNGDTQTLSNTLYTVDTFSEPGRIVPVWGDSWPSTRNVPNAVTVTYVAGGDLSTVARPIRTAILVTFTDWYENRESTVIGGASSEIPATAMRHLANHQTFHEFEYR